MRGAVAAVRLLPAASDLPSAPPGGRCGGDTSLQRHQAEISHSQLDDDEEEEEEDSPFGLRVCRL